jgi:hypothetical protein
MSNWQRWLLDVAERTGRTFLQGFLGMVTADLFIASFDPTWTENLIVGGLAGVYAVLTSWAAQPIGAPDSASMLPSNVDPPQA